MRLSKSKLANVYVECFWRFAFMYEGSRSVGSVKRVGYRTPIVNTYSQKRETLHMWKYMYSGKNFWRGIEDDDEEV